jgi:DNA-binding NtrC family response regulator
VQHSSVVNPGEVAGILVGSSEAVRELRDDIELASRTPARVLIAGEYGVGKKRLAELIHRQSLRGRAPFVSLRCGDLDANLEPRLFRRHNPITSLERADGGTVFFDRVDLLSWDAQLRLKHFVATGHIQSSSTRRPPRRTNVRVVSSTTIPLMQKLQTGSFSQELYYQLNTIYLPIRPLRQRPEDIEPLLEYFVAYYSRRMGVAVPRLSLDSRAICQAHHWPGNMRQLQTAASLFVTRSTPHDAVEVVETAERLCRQYSDA